MHCATRQLKDGAVAKLSDLNSSFEIVDLKSTVSQPQTHYCNAWGEKMLQQNLKMFPSGTKDPAAYYFPCFSWRSLYWDFAIWLPRRAKMVRPNPILDHWCMQSFRVKTPLLPLWKRYVSLGEFWMRQTVIYASLENQCRVEHDMSGILASLWINVHSVKKINWINTINSPQRCRISLVFSPRHLKSYTVLFFSSFFQKINICLCTVLRVAGIWNGRWVCCLCVIAAKLEGGLWRGRGSREIRTTGIQMIRH